jgi:metal-responsive CopG/Arc/MetJ family transcriptional regulator
MAKHVRISLTVPEGLNRRIDIISRSTGISKSALISELVSDRVDDIHGLVSSNNQFNGASGTTKRMRGSSAQDIQQSLSAIMDYLGLGGDHDSSVH